MIHIPNHIFTLRLRTNYVKSIIDWWFITLFICYIIVFFVIFAYFFNLSQLTFVALVLGGVTPLYTNIEIGINWYVLIAGAALTVILANIGNLILK